MYLLVFFKTKKVLIEMTESMLPFLTREYAKRNERVIGMDGIFTH